MEETFDIEKLIKSTFRLFDGVRSNDEDRQIYEEVVGAVVDEGKMFFSDYEKPIPDSALSGSNLGEKFEIFLERSKEIENGEEIFTARIRAFVNNLLARTLKEI